EVLQLEVQDCPPVPGRVEIPVETIVKRPVHVQDHAPPNVDHLRRRQWKSSVVGHRSSATRAVIPFVYQNSARTRSDVAAVLAARPGLHCSYSRLHEEA